MIARGRDGGTKGEHTTGGSLSHVEALRVTGSGGGGNGHHSAASQVQDQHRSHSRGTRRRRRRKGVGIERDTDKHKGLKGVEKEGGGTKGELGRWIKRKEKEAEVKDR